MTRSEFGGNPQVRLQNPARVSRHAVATLADLPPGTMRSFEVGGRKIIVVNLDGELHALDGICSHAYSELDKGFFMGDLVTCALHLSQFDVRTGEPISPPATDPLRRYPVAAEGETVYVDIPD